MLKKLLTGILAGTLSFGSFCSFGNLEVQAATRAEISNIQVKKSGNFQYWNKDSETLAELKNYVKDVTNKKSKNFIPVEDRIAVFDMEGTFLCETEPYYFEWMLYLERALYDENFIPSQADREYAQNIENSIRKTKKFPKNVDVDEAKSQESVFKGMTPANYEKYVQNFMQKPVEGLTNLKWGEAFYLPMVEVIKYLQANDFTVYIVSGSDRPTVRILACDLLKIAPNNVIGSDPKIISAYQDENDGGNYVYKKNDYLVRGNLIEKNLKMNKVSVIAQEIGKQPVLGFGNSSGDTSMLNYTVYGNKYKSAAFFVICDDLTREFGNTSKAESCLKLAQENGWLAISMKDDWKTIYGDNVKKG
ncbi:MAG: haloacid dehalogenase-like hydrolase [Selenomonadaceae bacterium]|nr:haloacid dehalogenase-like hydrolase [Selenomonadaceae bacterium]